jgi:hypothetical protein
MNSWQSKIFIAVLASPVTAAVKAYRYARHARLLKQSVQPATVCMTCGAEISLVGMWRCGCGFTYRGHLLRYCPVCGAFPNMIRCYRCDATEAIRI